MCNFPLGKFKILILFIFVLIMKDYFLFMERDLLKWNGN